MTTRGCIARQRTELNGSTAVFGVARTSEWKRPARSFQASSDVGVLLRLPGVRVGVGVITGCPCQAASSR
jgi:hypothetical protein